ncbi:MAG: TonB C-terminal domain-containing protein [Lentisphaerae bacterium]|nr:TonB C-terminal domain-containing protein [Lentisphaerota bacterium]
MKTRKLRRSSITVSLVLHGLAILLVLVGPMLFQSCNARRSPEKLMFVEFTVSVPPPSAPDIETPEPEPPAPEPPPPPEPDDDIKIPDPKPEPPKPKPPEPPKPKPKPKIEKGPLINRRGPPPKDKPLSPEEIAKLLKQGARISDTTQIPSPSQIQMGAYFNHVKDRMYAAWQQPQDLAGLPGLSAVVAITVEPNGRISDRRLTRSSGNTLMDNSVMKAVNIVTHLNPLPPGHTSARLIEITFELSR